MKFKVIRISKMTKYLRNYKREIEEILKSKEDVNWKKVLEKHRVMIGFLQHERLVHLLVTLFFALIFCLLAIVNVVYQVGSLVLVNFLVTVLLIFYVFHYFKLENGVQSLYKLDIEIEDRL